MYLYACGEASCSALHIWQHALTWKGVCHAATKGGWEGEEEEEEKEVDKIKGGWEGAGARGAEDMMDLSRQNEMKMSRYTARHLGMRLSTLGIRDGE